MRLRSSTCKKVLEVVFMFCYEMRLARLSSHLLRFESDDVRGLVIGGLALAVDGDLGVRDWREGGLGLGGGGLKGDEKKRARLRRWAYQSCEGRAARHRGS